MFDRNSGTVSSFLTISRRRTRVKTEEACRILCWCYTNNGVTKDKGGVKQEKEPKLLIYSKLIAKKKEDEMKNSKRAHRILAWLLTMTLIFTMSFSSIAYAAGTDTTGEGEVHTTEVTPENTSENAKADPAEDTTKASQEAEQEETQNPGALGEGEAQAPSIDENDVAAIGEQGYATLEAAVTAVKNGETIEVLSDCSGNGIVVQGNSGRTFTIDFNNHKYTVGGETVGSTGTETNGFQLLKGSTITMKDGTIVADTTDCRIMIQNYSNLTLDNMTLDATKGTNSVDYVLSNNCGNVNIKGNTSIVAKNGKHAFDLYYWPRGSYTDGVNVTVDTTGTISGIVEYGSDGSGTAPADMHDKCKLEIKNGIFNG